MCVIVKTKVEQQQKHHENGTTTAETHRNQNLCSNTFLFQLKPSFYHFSLLINHYFFKKP